VVQRAKGLDGILEVDEKTLWADHRTAVGVTISNPSFSRYIGIPQHFRTKKSGFLSGRYHCTRPIFGTEMASHPDWQESASRMKSRGPEVKMLIVAIALAIALAGCTSIKNSTRRVGERPLAFQSCERMNNGCCLGEILICTSGGCGCDRKPIY
jgi:hypothetical protein